MAMKKVHVFAGWASNGFSVLPLYFTARRATRVGMRYLKMAWHGGKDLNSFPLCTIICNHKQK